MEHERRLTALVMLALALPAMALAQAQQTAPATVSESVATTAGTVASALPADTVCMTRAVTNNGAAPFTFQAMVPPDKAQTLAAKGFVAAQCTGNAQQLTSYRELVCSMLEGNDAVQNRIEQVFGVRAETLCAAANSLAGIHPVSAEGAKASN